MGLKLTFPHRTWLSTTGLWLNLRTWSYEIVALCVVEIKDLIFYKRWIVEKVHGRILGHGSLGKIILHAFLVLNQNLRCSLIATYIDT